MTKMTASGRKSPSAIHLASTSILALSAVSLASGGCDDSTAEKLKAAELAGSCSINSDCRDPFVCAFTRCHVACDEDRDCDIPQRCVNGDKGHAVCQLPDETKCRRDKDCVGEQVCAADLECHDTCKSTSDCVGDQICVASGECASSDSKRDELDASGNLVPASPDAGSPNGTGAGGASGSGAGGASGSGAGRGGSSGAAGGGHAGGAGRPAGDGGPSGAGGASTPPDASTSGRDDAGSGGTVGDAGGTGGRSGDGAVVADFVEPGDVEVVDNNTYMTAIPAKRTASIYTTGSDQDWFSVRAPSGPGAYVITVDADQQSAARVIISAYDGVNRDPMGSMTTSLGAVGHVFITVRAGTTTYLEFSAFPSPNGPHRIDLTFTLTPENDAYEPNDTKDAAATITPNTDVAAQCIRAHVTASDSLSDDWYKVALVAGTATVKLVKDFQPGPRMTIGWATTAGSAENTLVTTPASVDSWTFNAPTDGIYYVHFRAFANTTPVFSSGDPPEFVKAQYVFQVQQ